MNIMSLMFNAWYSYQMVVHIGLSISIVSLALYKFIFCQYNTMAFLTCGTNLVYVRNTGTISYNNLLL